MGHVRLGVLPKSRKWDQVVDELRARRRALAIAASAADAAESSLAGRSNDPAFLHAFWLLTQVPLAARGPEFAQDLRRLGRGGPDQPGLMDVAGRDLCRGRSSCPRTWGPYRPWRDGSNGGGREPCSVGRAELAVALRAKSGGRPARNRTFRGRGSLQRSGARVLCPPDAAQPRLLSEPRALQPYRTRRAVSATT